MDSCKKKGLMLKEKNVMILLLQYFFYWSNTFSHFATLRACLHDLKLGLFSSLKPSGLLRKGPKSEHVYEPLTGSNLLYSLENKWEPMWVSWKSRDVLLFIAAQAMAGWMKSFPPGRFLDYRRWKGGRREEEGIQATELWGGWYVKYSSLWIYDFDKGNMR